MITVQNLCKTYKVAKRKAGMREACRSLFRREYEEIHALDHISFQIGDGEMDWIHWQKWSWQEFNN